jgi:ABC-2 type transport system permease protein
MKKVLHVLINDYRQIVFTKSFLFSLIFPVVIYGGMFLMGIFVSDKSDLRDRRVAVVDETDGVLYAAMVEAAEMRNNASPVIADGRQAQPFFLPELYEKGELSRNEVLIELSDKVRRQELFAFVWIGPNVVDVQASQGTTIEYYSDSPTYRALPDWINRSLRERVEEIRFEEAGLNLREIRRLSRFDGVDRYRLAERDSEGRVVQPSQDNQLAAVLIPIGIIMLLFFSIQMSMPVLLNSVIEEKMQRIAEVLLSSVTAFQLLLGKLLAGMAVGLTFSLVYLVTLGFSLAMYDVSAWVTPAVYVWYFPFLLTGLLTFGSMFAALSAACQDLKDTQNFIGVIMMVMILPIILAVLFIQSPDTRMAQILSMVPPIGNFLMMSRIAISPGPETWQIWLSLFNQLLFAWLSIWAAGRIFRIGILSQGKAPGLRELMRWIITSR